MGLLQRARDHRTDVAQSPLDGAGEQRGLFVWRACASSMG